MTAQERNEFFDAVFDLLMMEHASRPRDVIRPQNLRALFKTMQMDENRRRLIASVLGTWWNRRETRILQCLNNRRSPVCICAYRGMFFPYSEIPEKNP